MEQSSDDSTITDEEMEVASIILQLPHLLSQSHSRNRFGFTSWLSKKKRSTSSSRQKDVVAAAASSPTPKLSQPEFPPPPPSLPSNGVGSTHDTMKPMEKPLTSSPATPLSFLPSESDEKEKPQPQPPKRKSYVNNLKKKKEQLLETVEDFTRRNELLKKEIEIKKRFHHQQIAENLELKAKKQKIAMETENARANYHHHHEQQIFHQQPLMKDHQTVDNREYPLSSGMICRLLPAGGGGGISKLQQNDNVGQVGLFDLNVSAEELLELETATKARAAQARFKRKQICRSKNFNATFRAAARYPFLN